MWKIPPQSIVEFAQWIVHCVWLTLSILSALFLREKMNHFSLKMHQISHISFDMTILTRKFNKIFIQKIMCEIWCIFKEKWFIFSFKNEAIRSESVNIASCLIIQKIVTITSSSWGYNIHSNFSVTIKY